MAQQIEPRLSMPQRRLLLEADADPRGTTDLLRGQPSSARVLQRLGLGQYLPTGAGARGRHARFAINAEGRRVAAAYREATGGS